MDDQRIQTLLKAAAAFDRTAYGFTPLPKAADVRWESRPTARYDAMLHINSKTSRTIAFRRTSDGYRWTGEQEIFVGPNVFDTPDGPQHEEFTLTYELESISGFPKNRLNLTYNGKDQRFFGRSDLSLAEVKPILRKWGY